MFFVMNIRTVKNKRLNKTGRSSTVRKTAARKAAARKPRPTRTTLKPEPRTVTDLTVVTVSQITAGSSSFQMHKFRVGQAVSYTSSPVTRPGASGSYEVVRLLPSDGEDYQYRIKNPDEAFERVAKESQLELEH